MFISNIRCVAVLRGILPAVFCSLILSGCIGGVPDDELSADDAELAFASRVNKESSDRRTRNLVSSAQFNAATNSILVTGGNTEGRGVIISDSATQQLLSIAAIGTNANIGAINTRDDDDERRTSSSISSGNVNVRSSDDDDDNRLQSTWVVTVNLAPGQLVPCSIRVQSARGSQVVRVRNAPLTCSANVVNPSINQVLEITKAEWRISDGRLKVRGYGALPNDFVSFKDSFSGAMLGSVQANSRGDFSFSQTGFFFAPCAVTVISTTATGIAIVQDTPLACSQIIAGGFNPNVPNPPVNGPITGTVGLDAMITNPAFDQMAYNVGDTINFASTVTNNGLPVAPGQVTYLWTFDGMWPNSNLANPTVVLNRAGVYRVTLRVSDAFGNVDPTPATRVITVNNGTGNPIGQLPQLVMTPSTDQTIVAGQSVYFSASMNNVNPANGPYIYLWDFGGAANNSSQQTPGNVTFNFPGSYQVTLIAMDRFGQSLPPVYRTVTVSNGNGTGFPNTTNQAPNGTIVSPALSATQSVIVVGVGQQQTFQATAFDPDDPTGAGIVYWWDLDGAIGQSNTSTITASFPQEGLYVVALVVVDSQGMIDPVPDVRVVYATNNPTGVPGTFPPGTIPPGTGQGPINFGLAPQAQITSPQASQTIAAGQSLRFAGSVLNGNTASSVVYQWDFDDAAPASTVQNPGDIAFSEAGTYRIRLTAIDSVTGLRDETPAEVVVTVNDGFTINNPPVVQINSPQQNMSVSVGSPVTFTGTISDPDPQDQAGFFMYTLEFGGAAADISGVTNNNVSFSSAPVVFNRAGTFTVKLVAEDSRKGLSVTTRTITVTGVAGSNQSPEALITSPVTDIVVTTGNSVYFAGAAVDADNDTISYSWNFGAAAATNTQTAIPGAVTFNTPGVYTVTLNVSDSRGGFDLSPATRTIKVRGNGTGSFNQPPSLPTVTSSDNQQLSSSINAPTFYNIGQTIILTAQSFDPDGSGTTPLSYYWSLDGAASDSNLPAVQITFSRPGLFAIGVRAEDAQGALSTEAVRYIRVGSTASGTFLGTVNIDSPLAQTVSVGQPLIFRGSVNAASTSAYTYVWDFDQQGLPAAVFTSNNFTGGINTSQPEAVTFTQVGSFNVRLRVIDANGASAETTRTINVQPAFGSGFGNGTGGNINSNFTVQIVCNQCNSSSSVAANTPITLSANLLSGGTTTGQLNYFWDMGGGAANVRGQNPGSVVFANPGNYMITLTVTNSLGQTATDQVSILIQ